MITIAGVDCPCLDCANRCSSRRQAEVYHAVFKAIGSREPVTCDEYVEPRCRGLEGVRP
jgi:hypothetical protein